MLVCFASTGNRGVRVQMLRTLLIWICIVIVPLQSLAATGTLSCHHGSLADDPGSDHAAHQAGTHAVMRDRSVEPQRPAMRAADRAAKSPAPLQVVDEAVVAGDDAAAVARCRACGSCCMMIGLLDVGLRAVSGDMPTGAPLVVAPRLLGGFAFRLDRPPRPRAG